MYLHPDARKFLDIVAGSLPLDTQTPQQNRADIANAVPLTGVKTPMSDVIDAEISGVKVRVYWPDGVSDPAPCIIYFHGGGWVIGDLELCDSTVRDIAESAQAIAISVDYRLAPENPFPAAIEDALAVVESVLQGKSGFAIDTSRVAIAGDSAGGNMAAVVSQQIRDHSPSIAHQVLIYPATDLAGMATESYKTYAEGYFLTARDMRYFVGQYTQGADCRDPWISPLWAKDLSGLPPATIVVAELDPLVEDGRKYGRALLEAGNSVSVVEFMGQVHPFLYLGALVGDAIYARRLIGERIRDSLSR